MLFNPADKTARITVGDLAAFTLGPTPYSQTSSSTSWRAQIGSRWHDELRKQTSLAHPDAEFESPISACVAHRGWNLTVSGRIDQTLHSASGAVLREIKSTTLSLPADESELRADFPAYFTQLAAYVTLARLHPPGTALPPNIHGELVFVEIASGLTQTIPCSNDDERLFYTQLDRLTEFLELQSRARERLRHLNFRPAFALPRPGQESTQDDLTTLFTGHPLLLFEAPTGFGKTGALIEFALGQLRSGHFDRVLYLTGKSTGQLQVMRTLHAMTSSVEKISAPASFPTSPAPSSPSSVAAWHVRGKSEHCINHTFHCVRDTCAFLDDASVRWPQSGLARFYLDENHARDLETLRTAGLSARICPYEITRAALAFNDLWVADYNYVFSPRHRGLFFDQPGFSPARTLLLLDEAHNLPSRVADAFSHSFSAQDAATVRDDLHRIHAPATLVNAWDHWCHFLHHLRACDSLPLPTEDDARHLLETIAQLVQSTSLDLAQLGPRTTDALWSIPTLIGELDDTPLTRLWWSPRDTELALTCLDAAPAIGAILREFGGVVLASATLTPVEDFSAACGLDTPPTPPPSPPSTPDRFGDLTKRDTRRLFRQLTSGAALLRETEARSASTPALLRAHTPWRDGAYDIAFDTRVDTTFQHRSHHYTTTAATVATLRAASTSPIAVFFPSYAYAEAIRLELASLSSSLRVALQPRLRDLASQASWVTESLLASDALFLVLGSSFAEGIDSLGGRVTHAMVVGPALPEVNAVQRARFAEFLRQGLDRDTAFQRTYQTPGMTKVNQALGRLVRAPGQRARVLLHCRRFIEPSYTSLLAPEYRTGTRIFDDATLATWLATP